MTQAPLLQTTPPIGPTPPEAPLDMPVQDLRIRPKGPARTPQPRHVRAARIIAFGGAALITGVGFWQMLLAFGDQILWLQIALLALFTLTFGWIGFSFTSVLAGLLAQAPDTPEGPNDARIAVVMPVYHENAAEVAGILAALAHDLDRAGMADRTEIFIISDSRKPEAWLAETTAFAELRDLSPVPVWYRRRTTNDGRKAGNVAEFVRRWGGRYDQMIVLDADSVVGADTIKTLSARMNGDPALGLIQTMPMLVGGQTIFARLTQFAGRVYGPAVARGVAAWSGDDGNFWGHNALIRTRAFAQCCGLPHLSGKPPFGGTILSHDFVEAALLRRAGWKVRLDHDLRISFEGSPPTLLDMAVRERRWAQGNLQHVRVIGAKGLTWVTRAHFIIGILGFVMSPVWLAMILVGLALTAHVLLSRPEYFPETYQLFPTWPTFDPVRMIWLFVAAMGFLLLPKFIALIRAARRPLAKDSGGPVRITASAVFEIVLSSLIAPVQMINQTRQISEILMGRDSGWEAQVRAGSMPGWSLVLRRHALQVVFGTVTAVVLWFFAPVQLAWLSPILAGLILSPVVSRYSASPVIGRWARRRGLLVTPEERDVPAILSEANTLGHRIRVAASLDDLTDDEMRARHMVFVPPRARPDPRPAAARLDEIAARAKIEAAASRGEALDFLSDAERNALLGSADLLALWAARPA